MEGGAAAEAALTALGGATFYLRQVLQHSCASVFWPEALTPYLQPLDCNPAAIGRVYRVYRVYVQGVYLIPYIIRYTAATRV